MALKVWVKQIATVDRAEQTQANVDNLVQQLDQHRQLISWRMSGGNFKMET